MNLIQQLQATPKWKEFEEWYNKNPKAELPLRVGRYDTHCGFVDISLMFQKGVFEKYIESRGCNVITWVGEYQIEYCLHAKGYVAGKDFSTFEELLIWYFNN